MARKANIPSFQEVHAYDLFMRLLPYYWATAGEVPARLRLALALSGYPSANAACVDIANHWLVTPKLAKSAARALVHMQTWKCMPGRSKKA